MSIEVISFGCANLPPPPGPLPCAREGSRRRPARPAYQPTVASSRTIGTGGRGFGAGQIGEQGDCTRLVFGPAEGHGDEFGGAGGGVAAQLALDGGFVAGDDDVRRAGGAFAVEHGAVARGWPARAKRSATQARAVAGSAVTVTKRPATTRGAGRPAAVAARVMVGTTWSARVAGPAQTVMVPSASSPARRSMTGPRAATRREGGAAFGMVSWPTAVRVSPW